MGAGRRVAVAFLQQQQQQRDSCVSENHAVSRVSKCGLLTPGDADGQQLYIIYSARTEGWLDPCLLLLGAFRWLATKFSFP